ncbi:MAG: CHAP domain-containing protein [Acidocella sp. 35-58-6]|nr:MAG: CHAP domain-containing protein [Acidocella sp. 20-58-15]OYY05296.1 MAG: CHAP domain-containing protein [Acidocella sp. 35-58-6]
MAGNLVSFRNILAVLLLACLTACGGGQPNLGTQTSLTCVPYAREVSGIQLAGDAWAWWDEAAGRYPRSQKPAPGAVLVFKPYGSMTSGHLAVVTSVQDSRDIQVTQSNWVPYRIENNQPVIDVSPANDWTEVRVWYEPVKEMGVTVYPTDGFILPH